MNANMSNVTPFRQTSITRESLLTLQEAESSTITRAIAYLRISKPEVLQNDLAEILGVSRHALKRRLLKYGMSLNAR